MTWGEIMKDEAAILEKRMALVLMCPVGRAKPKAEVGNSIQRQQEAELCNQ